MQINPKRVSSRHQIFPIIPIDPRPRPRSYTNSNPKVNWPTLRLSLPIAEMIPWTYLLPFRWSQRLLQFTNQVKFPNQLQPQYQCQFLKVLQLTFNQPTGPTRLNLFPNLIPNLGPVRVALIITVAFPLRSSLLRSSIPYPR